MEASGTFFIQVDETVYIFDLGSSIMFEITVFVRVSTAVIKHHDQNNLGRKEYVPMVDS